MDDPKKPANSSPDSGSEPSSEEPTTPAESFEPEEPLPDSVGSLPEAEEPAKSPYDEQADDESQELSPAEDSEQVSEKKDEPSPPPGTVSKGEPQGVVDSDDDELDSDEDEDEEVERSQLGGRMTFLEHLDELRRRILFAAGSLMVTFVAGWIFRERIFGFLSVPILDVVEKLVVIRPTEPFTIYLKVSFVAAVFLAAPFILFQVWLFIAPGLYRREKSFALPFLLSSTSLFILGGLFAYYVVLPPALNFLLLEFGAEFAPMISAVEFFDFELIIILGMGVVFQLPVLVAFLSIFGLVTPRFLWKNFRYAFLIITIIAAVVSPTTDPLNLFLWSGPMVILYTVSIGISWVFQRRRQRKARQRGEDK